MTPGPDPGLTPGPPLDEAAPPAAAERPGKAGCPGAPESFERIDERDLSPVPCTFHLAVPDETDERRNAGRFPMDRVHCDAGRVRDLSRTGLRLARRGRFPAGRPVALLLSDGENTVEVACEIRWERKTGFRKREYGLQFLELTDEDSRAITRIAANCREQRSLAPRRAS